MSVLLQGVLFGFGSCPSSMRLGRTMATLGRVVKSGWPGWLLCWPGKDLNERLVRAGKVFELAMAATELASLVSCHWTHGPRLRVRCWLAGGGKSTLVMAGSLFLGGPPPCTISPILVSFARGRPAQGGAPGWPATTSSPPR